MSRLYKDPEMLNLLGIDPPVVKAALDTPYDGASKIEQETAFWDAMDGSADQEMLGDKAVLDSRTRDMERNDAFVQSGVRMRKDHVVGNIYLLSAKPAFKALGLDQVWADEFKEEVEIKFNLIANSESCWLDAARKNTFTEMVRLAVGIHMMGGEYIGTSEWIKDKVRPFKTAIQNIDLARLSTPAGLIENKFLRSGIKKDKFGAPVGYYFRRSHPSEWLAGENYLWDYSDTYKPWGRKIVQHIFETVRPDQTRAVSALASSLSELKITKQFRKTAIKRAIMDSSMAASIESELPTEAIMSALGSNNLTDEVMTKAINAYSKGFLNSVREYSGSRGLRIDGVKIPHFLPGTKLNVRPVGHGGPLGTDFEKSLLRYLAAAFGVSYEQLSRDFSESNYSNFKAASNETQRSMASIKKHVADRFANWVYGLWLEEAIASGEITSMPKNAPNFWEGINREAYTSAEWIGAGRGQIDELKETQAAVLRLKYHLTTHEDETARLGKDSRAIIATREREVKDMEKRGLQVDPKDNSLNAASGSPQERAPRDSKNAIGIEYETE